MARDPLFGERIVWAGRPTELAPPPLWRGVALVFFIISAISLSFALVIALVLRTAPAGPMLFSLWCASLGIAAREVPRMWLAKARYVVTDEHVIVYFGPFRRSIERRAISFARIFWNDVDHTAGDLELVRAVPTGALRRRLMLKLYGVRAPDRVWAIVRGAEAIAPSGQHGERPLAQRLDHGERVIWSARRHPQLRAYLPHGQREWSLVGIGGFLFAGVGRMVESAIPALRHVARGGLPVLSFPFAALTFGLSLAVLLVFAVGCYVIYDAVIRQAFAAKHTRYLITDKRVLIQRGAEELHVDRQLIVDVIDAPIGDGLHDVFFVLDGPRARALAASGAFGELGRGPHLRPVFEAVDDAEGATRVLRGDGPEPELPHAA
ncbi:MAG TPA: hypothetical protein VGM44_05915 [Polyangiaceae bacterium]